MAQNVVAVIPARLGSRRFSGKVIYPYQGKPLLFYVHRELLKSKMINKVVIATDNYKIAKVACEFGADVFRTSPRHKTGSDRIAETMNNISADIIVNIQADNLGFKVKTIDSVISSMLTDKSIKYATLARRIEDDDVLFDPNKVKVILDKDDNALWFSRFPLPFIQHPDEKPRYRQFKFWEHIGIYFFRRRALEQYATWPRSPLEKAESLEQLRIMEHGGKIRVFKTNMQSISIDSPDDLKDIKL